MSLISELCRQNETMRAAQRGQWRMQQAGTPQPSPAQASMIGTRVKCCVAAGRGSSIRAIESTAVQSFLTSGGDLSGHWRRILRSGTVRPQADIRLYAPEQLLNF